MEIPLPPQYVCKSYEQGNKNMKKRWENNQHNPQANESNK